MIDGSAKHEFGSENGQINFDFQRVHIINFRFGDGGESRM